MATELERIAALEVLMTATQADIADMHREIFGPPRADSVKGRLHFLESSHVAASAAEAALKVAKQLHDDKSQRVFTKKEKRVAVAISLAALVSPWLMLLATG